GIGVEVAANRLDRLGDGLGGAGPGALERHVLEQVRDAVDLCRLVARADADPDAERDAFHRVHAVAGDGEAVGEAADRNAHATAPAIIERARICAFSASASAGRVS